jgi:hypothetical protein|tara:strand:- start:654 stop:839 length:186 start_codon:yes stop_codon:yes gene_type:complete
MISLLELLANAATLIVLIAMLRGAWLIVEDKERIYQQRKLKNKGNKCQSDKLTNTQPVENG